ncbi:MAG: amidohydrolase family protein [Dehalococcoidia bacterium]
MADPVIDADGHVEPSIAVDWSAYAPEPYATQMTRLARRKFDLVGDITALRRGMWDPQERLRDMDAEGIDVAVLFGGLVGLSLGAEFEGVRGPEPHQERAYAVYAAQAYNNWLAGYCRSAPDRLKGVALVPWADPDRAVQEMARAAQDLGFVAALMPVRLGEHNLDDSYFEPFYQHAERLGIALTVHAPGLIWSSGMHTHFRRHAFNFVTSLMQGTMDVICGGVLERHKSLRIAFLEGECGWLPFWLDRLDDHYEDLPHQAPHIAGPPSDYVRSGRLFVSCEPGEKSLPYVLSRVGDGCIVFASDYAHYDSLYPESVRVLRQRSDLPGESLPKLLGGNAARLYGLD